MLSPACKSFHANQLPTQHACGLLKAVAAVSRPNPPTHPPAHTVTLPSTRTLTWPLPLTVTVTVFGTAKPCNPQGSQRLMGYKLTPPLLMTGDANTALLWS
jgi:hypothetical protein